MNIKLGLMLTISVILGITGCGQKTAANNSNTAGNSANTAATPKPADSPANADTTAGKPATGSLATPTEAYKTAYAMRANGDAEGLKRVMSKAVLEFLTMMGKEEKKTLDDQLQDIIKRPQGPSDDVRNEKITGDTATLEYLKDKDEWSTMDFEKEGNDWKMTIPKGGAKDKTPKQPE